MRGLIIGLLALTLLETVLSSPSAPGRVGGLLSGAGGLVQRLADPTIPLIPPKAAAASTGATAAPTAILAASQTVTPAATANLPLTGS